MRHLFKYYRANDFLFETLSDNTLYCCDKSELNDPHDGLFSVSQNVVQTFSSKIIENLKKNFPQIPDAIISERVLQNIETSEFYSQLHSGQTGVGLNVCSFSENPEDELMWAHYADNFRGVCLEFDFSNVPGIEKTLVKVEYSNEVLEVNSLTADEITKALLTKRKAWTYETEWRMLVDSNIKKIRFQPENLKAICFGPRTSLKAIDKILSILNKNNMFHVKTHKIRINLSGVILE